MNPLLQKFGLHPLVAFCFITVDWMLFAEDSVLGPVGWAISCIVAAVITVPCILLQYYTYKDSWPVAISKGLIIGVLTAIPTPLPSIITAASGVLGTIGTLKALKDQPQKTIELPPRQD